VSHPQPSEREACEMLSNASMPAPVPLPTGEALANLAHELRDPLAAILLALELHSEDGDPAARRTLTMAARQARRTIRIVDDLFDLCAGSRTACRSARRWWTWPRSWRGRPRRRRTCWPRGGTG